MLHPDELQNRFGYHRANAESAKKHNDVRQLMHSTAVKLNTLIPDGHGKSLALTALQEAMHWSNSAIAMENDVDTQHPELPNDPELEETPKLSKIDRHFELYNPNRDDREVITIPKDENWDSTTISHIGHIHAHDGQCIKNRYGPKC